MKATDLRRAADLAELLVYLPELREALTLPAEGSGVKRRFLLEVEDGDDGGGTGVECFNVEPETGIWILDQLQPLIEAELERLGVERPKADAPSC